VWESVFHFLTNIIGAFRVKIFFFYWEILRLPQEAKKRPEIIFKKVKKSWISGDLPVIFRFFERSSSSLHKNYSDRC